MKPLESNVLICVEYDSEHQQFLKVVELGIAIKKEVLEYIETWVLENNTYYVRVKNEN